MVINIIKFLIIILPTLLSVALLTLIERKVMASIQLRRGPNIVGFGILQPLADGLKLLIKELIIPLKSNKILFLFSPILFLSLSFCSWSIIPLEKFVIASPNLAILVFLGFSSLSVYGILLGGWSSNSRYAFLGALRSASQMLSYELVLGLILLLVCILAQSFNLIDIVLGQRTLWYIIPLLPFFLMFVISILAETNRTPFDLPEAEAELVAGYNVEYSSAPFAFYFIAEYCNLIIWAHITVILFFGGWLPIISLSFLPSFISFVLKSSFILVVFCWIRAAMPRYRWDQLMTLAWRFFLPIILLANFFAFSNYFSLSTESVIMSFFIPPFFYPFLNENFYLFCIRTMDLQAEIYDCMKITNKYERLYQHYKIIHMYNCLMGNIQQIIYTPENERYPKWLPKDAQYSKENLESMLVIIHARFCAYLTWYETNSNDNLD
jgi:NADH-quinone oxidoreductase subunit H